MITSFTLAFLTWSTRALLAAFVAAGFVSALTASNGGGLDSPLGYWLRGAGAVVAVAMLRDDYRQLRLSTDKVIAAMGEPGRLWYVLDLIRALGRPVHHAPRLYSLLARLERDGVVASGWDGTRPRRRRLYWLASEPGGEPR